jgi:hypothetical protein
MLAGDPLGQMGLGRTKGGLGLAWLGSMELGLPTLVPFGKP